MSILGSVPVTGFIAPTSETDLYPSHDSKYGKGGFREVIDLVDRDSIPNQRRSEGMLVYVISNDTTYQLKGGITNSHWDYFNSKNSTSTCGSISTCSIDLDKLTYIAGAGEEVVYAHNLNTNQVNVNVFDSDGESLLVRVKVDNNSITIGPFSEYTEGFAVITFKSVSIDNLQYHALENQEIEFNHNLNTYTVQAQVFDEFGELLFIRTRLTLNSVIVGPFSEETKGFVVITLKNR